MAQKIKLKTRLEWEKIFSDIDACVTPVLDMSELLLKKQLLSVV